MLWVCIAKQISSLYLLQIGFQNILQSSIPLDHLMQLKSKPFLLTQRHQNHSANHINQTDETMRLYNRLYNQNKILKFSSIKKQNILAFGCSTGQLGGVTKDQNGGREISSGYGGVRRKFIYDQQTMKQMIQVLKQQNNELKAVVKMQQTQINYYEEQQKNLAQSSTPACPNIKKLQLQNHHLKKQSQALASELQKIKKSIKVTSIKQLETVNKVYEQQVKNLTAKLLGYEKSTKNLHEINNIIQRDFLSSVKNKELEAVLEDKMADLEQSAKVIRKLKNIIGQKNAEYQQLKQEKQKMEGSLNKVKITQQYVPKAQLLAKKKQLLSMTQMLEKMEAKLIQCESKAQALQQQNIDNMNRQTNKRKQVIAEFQKLKKNYEALQQALAQALKKNSDVSASLRMDCMPTLNAQFRKPKCPITVKVSNLKQVIQHITFNLQLQSIPPHQAPLQLCPHKQNQSSDNQTSNSHEQTKEQKISIRQLIKTFSQPPFNVAVFEQKQLLARYLVEIESEEENHNQFVNFDAETSLAYVRAIFKQVLKEYFVYGKEEEDACCAVVEQVYRRNEGKLKSGLLKSSIGVGQQKGNSHHYLQYLEQIQKQNQLNEYHLQFIRYWILKNTRNNYKIQSCISSNSNNSNSNIKLNNSKNRTASHNQKSIDEFVTFQEFLLLFRVQSYCTFITQDPNEEQQQQHELKLKLKQHKQVKQTGQECVEMRQGQEECRTDRQN